MYYIKTPLRVSLFGGGTDIPEYFKKNKGQVTGFTINKFIYIFANEIDISQGFKYILSYKNNEDINDINKIKHPLYKEVLKKSNLKNSFHFSSLSSIPASSGLGSSSSFLVGLIKIINLIEGVKASDISIAKKAINIERNILAEHGGWQDQLHPVFGGINTFFFEKDGDIKVEKHDLELENLEKLNRSMYIIFTEKTRGAKDIEKDKKISHDQKFLDETLVLAKEGNKLIKNKKLSLVDIGMLLNEGWRLKKSLAKSVTNVEIDEKYNRIIECGVYGAKLCGAGGGGFFFVLAKDEAIKKVKDNFKDSVLCKIKIDRKYHFGEI